MDPVEFILKNMTRKAGDQTPYTNYSLDECIRRGAEAFEWKKRWRPSRGPTAGRSSAAPACRSWRSAPASAAAAR